MQHKPAHLSALYYVYFLLLWQYNQTTDFALPISCMDKGRDDVSMFLLQDCGADINSTDDEELLNAAMMALLYKRSGLFWQLVTRPAINMRHVDNEVCIVQAYADKHMHVYSIHCVYMCMCIFVLVLQYNMDIEFYEQYMTRLYERDATTLFLYCFRVIICSIVQWLGVITAAPRDCSSILALMSISKAWWGFL